MSGIDEFVKKTEDEINKVRTDKRSVADAALIKKQRLAELTATEWKKLVDDMNEMTKDLVIDQKRVFQQTQGAFILGTSSLVLKHLRGEYIAEIKEYYTDDTATESLLKPDLRNDAFVWDAFRQSKTVLTTSQLAEALVKDLVNAYKETQIHPRPRL